MAPELVEAFCLSLPAAEVSARPGGGRAFAVAGEPFAALDPGGAVLFEAGHAALRALSGRPGVTPEPARPGWAALARPGALPADDLLDLLRAAYGRAVARLPRAARERVTAALRSPPPRR